MNQSIHTNEVKAWLDIIQRHQNQIELILLIGVEDSVVHVTFKSRWWKVFSLAEPLTKGCGLFAAEEVNRFLYAKHFVTV